MMINHYEIGLRDCRTDPKVEFRYGVTLEIPLRGLFDLRMDVLDVFIHVLLGPKHLEVLGCYAMTPREAFSQL